MSSTDTDTGGSDVPGPIGGKKMSLLKQLYRDSSDINFPRLFRFTSVASLLLVVASVVLLFTMGLKLSIDFEGGSVWEIPSQDFTAEQALEVLADKGIEGGEVQEATTVDGDRIVRVTGGA